MIKMSLELSVTELDSIQKTLEELLALVTKQQAVLQMVDEHFVMNDLVRFMPRVYSEILEAIKEGKDAGL